MRQEPTRKQSLGTRWMIYVTALGLSAGTGYWWGEKRHDTPVGTELGVTVGRRERKDVPKPPSLTAVELVRAVLDGSLDERQYWQHVRWLSEDEVKSAITELKDRRDDRRVTSDLLEMLFYRWGELDPMAANAAAKAMFPQNFSASRRAVITAWIKQGGGAKAWDAVMDEREMWACTESVPGEVSDMLVASLSDQDDATAFKQVLGLNDENSMVADILCRTRARRASETSESRATFLAAAATHPEPFVLSCARENLFQEWAKRDVQAARAGLMALSIPEDVKDYLQHEINSVARDKEREAERKAATHHE